MLKAIIFDLDGVIIDSEPQHARAAVHTLQELGVSVELSYCENFIGTSTKNMAKQMISDFGLEMDEETLSNKLNQNKRALVTKEGYIPVPGVTELIQKLAKQGIRLAIASSSSPKEIEEATKALHILKYFDKLISSSSVKNPKPAPDTFELALSKLGVNPKEVLIIEDSEYGIQAAKSAGIACIGFLNPNSGNQNLSDADILLASFEELDTRFFENTLHRSHGKPVQIASTRRLLIRELAVDDIPELYPIYTDPAIREYIDDIDDYLETEIEKQEAYIQNVYGFYGYGLWGVFSKTTGGLIGRCGIENHLIDNQEEIMLSYLLDSNHWGYGYALECCEAILEYAADYLDIHRIVAVIDKNNLRSLKTAQNLNMKPEKELIYKGRDSILYSISI